jgi:uncharacterized SAM-binding protein YcdF (DUF218 family)
MRDPRDTDRLPTIPRAASSPVNPGAELTPGGDRFENRSLERYTDLTQRKPSRRYRWWTSVLFFVVAAIPIAILCIMGAVYWQARTDETRHVDAIVVLGAAQYNGRPSNVLRARLDHALELYRGGYAPAIIVTGGRMPGDVYTEAGTSEQYLLDRGVPADAILMEDEGRDTWGSLQGVAEVAEGSGIHDILIVSDGFHLFRAELMANNLGFESYSSPATDSPIEPWSGEEFSYVIRETGGVIAFIPRLF